MKEYLAFDIECANNFRGKSKICSFGYVRADEKFRVLEKKDIVINPKARFHNAMAKKGDVQLAYSKQEFLSAPTFDEVYGTVRGLLENPDALVIGHSVLNDAGYLVCECARYRLPYLTYRFIDAQILHMAITQSPHVMSLDKIAAEYGIGFTAHKSDDDAYATFCYFQKLCAAQDCAPDELLDKLKVTLGSAGDTVEAMRCGAIKRTKDREIDRLHDCLRDNRGNKNGPLAGRRICLNLELERRDLGATFELVERVNALGGRVVEHARDCNIFIYNSARPCARCHSADNKRERGQKIEYWNEDELFCRLGGLTQSV